MSARRLLFLDQVRGYAIFGMILVNFLGLFHVMPWTLKHHHEGFSYADSIAPLFIFVVGIGYGMSFQKTLAREGLDRTRKRFARRYAIIAGLGLLYGGFQLRAAVWDALLHIGLSGLLALPLMHRSAATRVLAACLFLTLYQVLYSCTGYGDWVLARSINGGPLGPLSWVFLLLLGTAAHDCIKSRSGNAMVARFLFAAATLTAAGWLLRMEWPGVKAFWPFSQFGMSAPYPLYAAGLCFATVLLFYFACEVAGLHVPALTTLGKNPLVIYLLQAVLVLLARVILSPALGAPAALAGFLVVLGICYGVARRLERSGRIIKIG